MEQGPDNIDNKRACEGKRGYRKGKGAADVANRMQQEFPQWDYSWYYCQVCGNYHVGKKRSDNGNVRLQG